MAIKGRSMHDSEPEYSVAEAKGRLPALIHHVETDGAVHITRRGKPAAVLISEAEYARLQGACMQRPVAAAIRAWRERTDSRAHVEEGELDGLRDHSPGRDVDLV
jgi:prevent-host-death family protein